MRQVILLLVLDARRTCGTYWGEGWEDPDTKQLVNRALRVVSNDSSIPMEELTDNFDWLYFEDDGGMGKVKGNEGYEAQPLQSWLPRNDTVQHGHFMLYLMDDVVSKTSLDRPMEELFFSISLDAGVHPQYAADGVTNLNCTLRLFLLEGNAADEDLGRTLPGGAALGKDSDEQLVLKAGQSIVYQRTLTNAQGTYVKGEAIELKSAEQIAAANHTVTWGFHNHDDRSLKPPCVKTFKQLYVGVQCLQGFSVPETACAFDMLASPNYDDCRSYCPFVLTVRAVPRKLRDGETVDSMLGPGEWQTFEVDAGDYELVQLSLERREYDNATYAHVSQDGLGGEMWLSRDTCIAADVAPVEHLGYCPHGGVLVANATAGVDTQPHPLCSREANLSYSVGVESAAWVRGPHHATPPLLCLTLSLCAAPPLRHSAAPPNFMPRPLTALAAPPQSPCRTS